MREIKFRAWDKECKRMITGAYPAGIYASDGQLQPMIYLDGSVVLMSDEDGGKSGIWEHEVSNELEIMQYTGLKDKNGKEIYEGDIVRNTDGEIFRVDYAGRWARYMLSYDGEWCIKYLEDYGKLETYSLNMEVIGNIYENPELLKEETNE